MAGEESTIGALLDKTGGSIKTEPFGTKLKAAEYTSTGVPAISVGEVGVGRLRIHDKTPRVDESVWSRMPEFVLKAGDIVFGRKGAVERSAQLQPDEEGYFLGSDGIRIRLNSEACDPRFLAYQLQTTAHRSWMIQHAAGTTMPSLNEGIIRRIPIVLKPLAEQKATADLQQRTHGTVFDTITRQTFETLDCIFPPAPLTQASDRTVAPLLAQIRANLHQSRTLATLRDTLLPKLPSGELRVTETGNRLEAEQHESGAPRMAVALSYIMRHNRRFILHSRVKTPY